MPKFPPPLVVLAQLPEVLGIAIRAGNMVVTCGAHALCVSIFIHRLAERLPAHQRWVWLLDGF